MISKKHFTKSMATILSTLTFLTAVSPCTFAEGKNFNKKTTGSMSTTSKILLAVAVDIGLAAVIGGAVYTLSKDPSSNVDPSTITAELLKAIEDNNVKKAKEILDRYHKIINFDSPIEKNGDTLNDIIRVKPLSGAMIKLLRTYNANVKVADKDGNTPLHHIAAFYNCEELCIALIKNGANVNAKNNYGDTPLHIAANHGCKKICEILIKRGAGVNAKGNCDNTPLHFAASSDEGEEVCKVLIDNHADVNAKNNDGKTPLHIAASLDHEKVCALLINNHADVNAKKNYGKTPLHIAASLGHEKACKVLINNHADVNAKDNDGKTPLDFTSTDEIKQLLLGHGAKYGKELNE